jgi:hypothetical protein
MKPISIVTRRPIDENVVTIRPTGLTDENGLEVHIAVVEDGYGQVSEVEFTGIDCLIHQPKEGETK